MEITIDRSSKRPKHHASSLGQDSDLGYFCICFAFTNFSSASIQYNSYENGEIGNRYSLKGR